MVFLRLFVLQVLQAGYQAMDPGFVGLIVSCFNALPQHGSRLQVIAFQSVPSVDIDDDIDLLGMDTPTRDAILASSRGALLHLLVCTRLQFAEQSCKHASNCRPVLAVFP